MSGQTEEFVWPCVRGKWKGWSFPEVSAEPDDIGFIG